MYTKRIHIFSQGRNLSTNGKVTHFTDKDLDSAVESYDEKNHTAPIILGHDETNSGAPAYGWIKSLEREKEKLYAIAEFTEEAKRLIEAGHYRKRSASFYAPSSPVNPKPGTWSLRHLALLGASPPAIKSLEDFSFMESKEEEALYAFDIEKMPELNFSKGFGKDVENYKESRSIDKTE